MPGARNGPAFTERTAALSSKAGEQGVEKIGNHSQNGQMLATGENKSACPGKRNRKMPNPSKLRKIRVTFKSD